MPPVFCVKSFGKKREDNKLRKDRSKRKWSDLGHFLPYFGAKSPCFIGFLSYAKMLVSRAFCLKISRERSRIGSNPITRTMQIRTGTIRPGPYSFAPFFRRSAAIPPQYHTQDRLRTPTRRDRIRVGSLCGVVAGSRRIFRAFLADLPRIIRGLRRR